MNSTILGKNACRRWGSYPLLKFMQVLGFKDQNELGVIDIRQAQQIYINIVIYDTNKVLERDVSLVTPVKCLKVEEVDGFQSGGVRYLVL